MIWVTTTHSSTASLWLDAARNARSVAPCIEKKRAVGLARGGNKRGISLDLSIPYGARIFIQDQSLFIRLMARLYKKHIFSFVQSLSIFKEIALFKYKKIPGGR